MDGIDNEATCLAYPYSQGNPNKKNTILPQLLDALDNEKARAAAIFKTYWFRAKDDPQYLTLKKTFRDTYYESKK